MWTNPGELLRLWREEVLRDPSSGKCPSPRDVEERCRELLEVAAKKGNKKGLRLSHQTIRNWEAWESSNARSFNEGLKVLDQAYGARGALEGLALATPKVFPARRVWAHNFNPPRSPLRKRSDVQAAPAVAGPRTLPVVQSGHESRVWAWVRPGPDAGGLVDVRVQWGVFEAQIEHRFTGDSGLFLTSRVSTPHPAAFVRFTDTPGWVDFGYGRIPAALDVETLREVNIMSFREGSQSLIRLFKEMWRTLMDRVPSPRARQSALLAMLLDAEGAGGRRDASAVALPQGGDPWTGPYTGADYAALREARGMTRSYVGSEVGVSELQLAHFENGGTTSVDYLPSRLDVVYGADGFTCRDIVEEVQSTGSGSQVTFPAYWVGPVVLTLTASEGGEETAPMDLRWGNWHAPLLVRSGRGVSCRCDVPGEGVPLKVDHPQDWDLRVELGHNPDAVDINGGNWDVAEGREDALVKYNGPIYMRLLKLLASPDDPE